MIVRFRARLGLALTCHVRVLADVWLRNSFGKLRIVSTITPWIQIDQTELETSSVNLNINVNVPAVSTAIVKALNVLTARANLNHASMLYHDSCRNLPYAASIDLLHASVVIN
jgi:hypothetical protein